MNPTRKWLISALVAPTALLWSGCEIAHEAMEPSSEPEDAEQALGTQTPFTNLFPCQPVQGGPDRYWPADYLGAPGAARTVMPDIVFRACDGTILSSVIRDHAYSNAGNISTFSWITKGVGPDWRLADYGDIDNNRATVELLWQHSSGGVATWQLREQNLTNGVMLSLPVPLPSTALVRQLARLDNDGFADILVRDDTTGANKILLLNPNRTLKREVVLPTVGAPWELLGGANIDGVDNQAELLWRYNGPATASLPTGAIAFWRLNADGTYASAGFVSQTYSAPAPWKLIGVAPFMNTARNGNDSIPDLAFHNNGGVAIWALNSSGQVPGSSAMTYIGPPAVYVGHAFDFSDYTNDGRADILAVNSGGELWVRSFNSNGTSDTTTWSPGQNQARAGYLPFSSYDPDPYDGRFPMPQDFWQFIARAQVW